MISRALVSVAAAGVMVGVGGSAAMAADTTPAPKVPAAKATTSAKKVTASDILGLTVKQSPWVMGEATMVQPGKAESIEVEAKFTDTDPQTGAGFKKFGGFSLTATGGAIEPGCEVNTWQNVMNLPHGIETAATCWVDVPALRVGESRPVTVTLKGVVDGREYTQVRSFTAYAADVHARVLLDGKDITGTKVTVTEGSTHTVRYEVANRSPWVITGVNASFKESLLSGGECTIAKVAGHGTGSCEVKVRVDRKNMAPSSGPHLPTLGFTGPQGTRGSIDFLSTTAVLGTPSAATKQVTATQVPAQQGNADTTTSTANPPLAQTGLPVGATLATGLGLIGAGAGAFVIARRRRG